MNTIHEQDGKTVVLLLSWRDIRSPKSGGAEIFTHEMLKRSQQGRFQFIHFSPQFEGMPKHEVIDGITYIRKGNIYSVIYYAMRYYRRHRGKIDYVILTRQIRINSLPDFGWRHPSEFFSYIS
nr:hypothetical protein [Paenibacillus polymyxa]